MTTFEDLEARILELLQSPDLADRVPRDRLDDICDLIKHGEYGVAVENLCENLFDVTDPLSAQWLARLEQIVLDLGLDDHYRNIVRKIERR